MKTNMRGARSLSAFLVFHRFPCYNNGENSLRAFGANL